MKRIGLKILRNLIFKMQKYIYSFGVWIYIVINFFISFYFINFLLIYLPCA